MATQLPEQVPPKAPRKVQTIPTYLGRAKGSTISNPSSNTTNLVLSDHIRVASTMNEVIRRLVLNSPDLSHAVFSKIYSALSSKYKVLAYDDTGRVDEPATEIAQSFIQRLNLSSNDYTRFTSSTDVRSLVASLLFDSLRYGVMGTELVLGEGLLPSYIKPIPMRLITWADGGENAYPIYKGSQGDVPLNFPTIMISSSILDNETPYADSPLQAAIQACLWDADFIDTLRRTATRNLLQRLVMTIDSEKYKSTLPYQVTQDQEKLKEHMDALTAQLELKLADLQPEDALVLFDVLQPEMIGDANRSEDRSITILQEIINGKIASGTKTLPSILGRGKSSNAASTEALLFLKSIAVLQHEASILISRNLTLVLRLLGQDSYAEFIIDEVNLRPESELETFQSVRQSRMLELLSLGMITDTEASIALTGKLPPTGYKKLSGTMFRNMAANISGSNDYSNTSASTDAKPNSTQAQKTAENTK